MFSDRNEASPLEVALLDRNIGVVLLLLGCLLIVDFIIAFRLWLVIHRPLVRVLPIDHLLEPAEWMDLGRLDLQIHDLIRFCGLPFDGRLEGAYSGSSRHSAGFVRST